MKIQNGGPLISRDEVVLFSFDDHSLPFQRGVRLHLVDYHSSSEGGTRIVVPLGPPGSPDSIKISYYGAVHRVGDELYMWYQGQGEGKDDFQRICFAKSKDGYNWEKPNLGLVEYNGNKDNNLVDLGGGKYVVVAWTSIYEPDDPDPQRRFKAVYETHRRNPAHGGRAEFNVAFSGDGVNWVEPPVNPSELSCEMSGLIKFNGAYYVTAQSGGGHFGPPRKLETFISYDFENWVAADCMGFMRGDIPPRPMIYDSHAGEQVHLGAGLWDRGNVIIGIYGMWHGHVTNDRRLVAIDLGFVVSNDALHYREPVPDFRMVAASEDRMGKGEAEGGSFRYPALEQGQGFENIGDETLFWYGAWAYRDGVRLATWPRDRLGYFEPFKGSKMRSLQESHFISAPIDLEGKPARVALNVAGISEQSNVKVQVLDEQFRPLAGYDLDSYLDLDESGLRQPVRWQGHDLIENVAGSVRVRVDFAGNRPEDVRLYAVYLETSGQAR